MSVPRMWRNEKYRYRLEASRCKGCDKTYLPARLICPACGGTEFDFVKLPDKGKVVTYSMVNVGTEKTQFEVPYVIAIIELENGHRLTTQVVDTENKKVAIGSQVRLVFRKIQEESETGVIGYGYKAVLT